MLNISVLKSFPKDAVIARNQWNVAAVHILLLSHSLSLSALYESLSPLSLHSVAGFSSSGSLTLLLFFLTPPGIDAQRVGECMKALGWNASAGIMCEGH